VMMALMNNWDVKDENNSIYEPKERARGSADQIYAVSDLGATFGTPGLSWPSSKSRDNVREYQRAKFIGRVGSDRVDFTSPKRAGLWYLITMPQFIKRMRLRWIGRDIPRKDARWIGDILGQLSSEQISDAFRAAGYSRDEVLVLTNVVENRISELREL
jgi:hypothetical protein